MDRTIFKTKSLAIIMTAAIYFLGTFSVSGQYGVSQSEFQKNLQLERQALEKQRNKWKANSYEEIISKYPRAIQLLKEKYPITTFSGITTEGLGCEFNVTEAQTKILDNEYMKNNRKSIGESLEIDLNTETKGREDEEIIDDLFYKRDKMEGKTSINFLGYSHKETMNFTYVLGEDAKWTALIAMYELDDLEKILLVKDEFLKIKNQKNKQEAELLNKVRERNNWTQENSEENSIYESDEEIGSPFGNSKSDANEGVGSFGSFSLSGRTLREGGLQRPTYSVQVEGRIVINITVDNYGNVISAAIGKGTTIDDKSMRNSALQAAREAKFNRIQSKGNQMGTITYTYIN